MTPAHSQNQPVSHKQRARQVHRSLDQTGARSSFLGLFPHLRKLCIMCFRKMYVDRTGSENPFLKYGKRAKILQAASYCEPCLLTTPYSCFSLVLSLMEDVTQFLLYFKHIWSCYTTKSTGSSISLLQSSLVYW